MSARELHVFYTPAAEEIAWARENADSDEHLLGLVIQLKTFRRLGYFPALDAYQGAGRETVADARLDRRARAVNGAVAVEAVADIAADLPLLGEAGARAHTSSAASQRACTMPVKHRRLSAQRARRMRGSQPGLPGCAQKDAA